MTATDVSNWLYSTQERIDIAMIHIPTDSTIDTCLRYVIIPEVAPLL